MVSSGIGPRDKEVGFLAHAFIALSSKRTHRRTSARQNELATFFLIGWKNCFLELKNLWDIGGESKKTNCHYSSSQNYCLKLATKGRRGKSDISSAE